MIYILIYVRVRVCVCVICTTITTTSVLQTLLLLLPATPLPRYRYKWLQINLNSVETNEDKLRPCILQLYDGTDGGGRTAGERRRDEADAGRGEKKVKIKRQMGFPKQTCRQISNRFIRLRYGKNSFAWR